METSAVPGATVGWGCAGPGSWKGPQRLKGPHPALGRPSVPAGHISGRFPEMPAGPCSALPAQPSPHSWRFMATAAAVTQPRYLPAGLSSVFAN